MACAFVISQYVPPAKQVATIRMTEIANQFAEHDFDVYLCSSYNYKLGPTDQYSLHPEVKTIRTHSGDFLIVWQRIKNLFSNFQGKNRKTRRSDSNNNMEALIDREGRLSWKSHLLHFLSVYLPFTLIFGEGNLVYIIRTVFKILPKVSNGDIVFTSYSPYSDLLIGFLIKKFRSGVIWIADFRDPDLPPNQRNWFLSWHLWLNRRIFKNASLVTAVSRGVLDNIKLYNKNRFVLHNGIIGRWENSVQSIPGELNSDKFKITYVGSLYGGLRNPLILFQALKEMSTDGVIDPERVRVIYAGNERAVWDRIVEQADIESMNEAHDMLSLNDSNDLQAKTHINLLLTWADRNYRGVLTGKMYEYFRARKPILAIVQGDRDIELEEMLNEIGLSKTIYSNLGTEEIKLFINHHYQRFIQDLPLEHISPSSIHRFYWDETFPRFLEAIRSIK